MEDISPILQHWPYHPNNINVRLIEGADGKKKIQMRLDLGILQMEMDEGRTEKGRAIVTPTSVTMSGGCKKRR
jgi:hypothetical protein